MSTANSTVLIVMLIAFLAPLIVEIIPKVSFPSVVMMILLGIVVGPQGLQLAESTSVVDTLSRIGLSFLFFIAGLEIDLRNIRGRPLTWALKGWFISLTLSFLVTLALHYFGFLQRIEFVAAALATTSLGSLLPILKEANLINTRFGLYATAGGTVGEVAPLLLMTLVLQPSDEYGSPARSFMLCIVYLLTLLVGSYVALKVRPPILIRSLRKSIHGGSQLPVRLCLLILTALTLLSNEMGMESSLGSLSAGVIVGLALKGESGEAVRKNLEAIGFGLLIPVFFIRAGLNFDLNTLLHAPGALFKVPVFLLLFLLVRGVPAWFCRNELPRGEWIPLALMSSTTLALVVAITHLGVITNQMRVDTAVALVSAAMLGKLLFPTFALTLTSKDGAAN